MEYLFGLIFKLFKIYLQSYLYAFLLLKLLKLYATQYSASWVARAYQRPSLRWFSRLLISAALFVFSCTYWGDHGLGDYARIPLGYNETIEEINVEAYFEATVPYEHPTDQSYIESYQVANEILCAKSLGEFYFIYDLATKSSKTFTSTEEYDSYAAYRGLPTANQFQSFGKHYSQYWSGWRFWLLA